MAHSLERSIHEKEDRITRMLEETGIISDIEFHHHNFFSLKFKIYNNARAKAIIYQCYEEMSKKINEQVGYVRLQNQNQIPDRGINCRIDIDPAKKGSSPQIIDSILSFLAWDIESYLQKHQLEIRANRMIKQKRVKQI
jgi:hypothetical protein